MNPLRVFAVLIAMAALAPAQRQDPAVVRAGSLTVRIPIPALGAYGSGGLAQFNTPDTPVTIEVQLSNSGNATLRGTVRPQVTDLWKTDPATPIPFSLGPKASESVTFQVQFGRGTYNAPYPIHAYVEFEEGGRKLLAHPILQVTPTQPNPPLASGEVEWKPYAIGVDRALALWRLPLHREQVRVEQRTGYGMPSKPVYATTPTVDFTGSLRKAAGPEPGSAAK